MSNRGYSQDLRKRIVATVDEGHTFADVAEMFKVGFSTVKRYVDQWNAEATLEPKAHGGGAPRALSPEQRALLKRFQEKWPDKKLADLTALFTRATKTPVSVKTVGRELRAMGYTRKKNAQGERAEPSRRPPGAKGLR